MVTAFSVNADVQQRKMALDDAVTVVIAEDLQCVMQVLKDHSSTAACKAAGKRQIMARVVNSAPCCPHIGAAVGPLQIVDVDHVKKLHSPPSRRRRAASPNLQVPLKSAVEGISRTYLMLYV